MAKIICVNCKRKCRGDVLKVADKYFHKSCFTCSKCNVNLEKGGFFMKDDGFYCQEDYQRYFVAKCKVCTEDLIGEIVTVMNFSFHRECFKCTGCAISFHPGDRVTVWRERFFCPRCISQQSIVGSSHPNENGNMTGGTLLSPSSVTDDEGCISAAEASLSDLTSPQGKSQQNKFKDTTQECEKKEEFRLSSSDSKCMLSSGFPQKSKSILRKTGTETNKLRSSSREHGYLSTDSGLGERLSDSKTMVDQSQTLTLPERVNDGVCSHVNSTVSPTLSSHQSRQSLHSRVPNSDYGRHLSQSYMHLGDPLTQTDRYKRNVSFNSLNKPTQTKHFHIPETKHRYLPPGVRTCELLFGKPVKNIIPAANENSQPRRIFRRPVTRSAFELDQKTAETSISTSISPDLPNGVVYPPQCAESTVNNNVPVSPGETVSSHTAASTMRSHVPIGAEEHEVTVEARRLSCFPSGQQRDQSVPAPIERYDWPGPPASAVILAELMRERRCRRRQHGQVNGCTGVTNMDDGDDAESQEALSIDCTFEGGVNDPTTPHHSSGIGQAIIREELEQKRRSQSQQFIDPISASRTPNAAYEPSFKPRYATHQFAFLAHRSATNVRVSPNRLVVHPPVHSGQPLRPGYTGGCLSSTDKTTSLPASSLLLNSGRTGQTSALWQSRNQLSSERSPLQNGHGDVYSSDRTYSQSVHGLSTLSTPRSQTGIKNGLVVVTPTNTETATPNGLSPTGINDSSTDINGLTGNTLSYPSVLLTSTPSSLFHKPNPPPPPKADRNLTTSSTGNPVQRTPNVSQ